MTTTERRAATEYVLAPEEQQIAQIARFIQWVGINSLQRGYMQIAGGNPNPAEPWKIALDTHTIKSFLIDNTNERPELAREAALYAASLDVQGYSVYCTMRLYKNRGRKQDAVHDSYLIFTDDVKDYTAAPLPFTLVVQTSEHSHHCYYVCDTKTTQGDARRVCAFHGADSTGTALNKFVRIPGTHNTKSYGAYPVAVVQRGRAVKLTDVRAAHPEVAGSTKDKKGVHTTPDYDAAEWENLPDGKTLAATGRYQKTFTVYRKQLGDILAGKRIITKRSDGSTDKSDSAQRAAFVNNLLQARLTPPLDEIRALAMHFKDKLGKGMAKAAYQRHIDMCIKEYMPAEYKPEPTKYTTATGTRSENKSTRQRGRPAGAKEQGINTLIAYLDAVQPDTQGRKIIHQPTVAAALGVSIKTLYNRFEVLEAEHGIAKRQIDARGNFEIITTDVMRSENNVISNQEAICSTATPKNGAEMNAHIESTCITISTLCVLSNNMSADLISEDSARPAQRVTLSQAVREAFEMYGGIGSHQKPLTSRAIAEYIASNYPDLQYKPQGIKAVITTERKRQRAIKADADLHTLTDKQLAKEARQLERCLRDYQKRDKDAARREGETPQQQAKRVRRRRGLEKRAIRRLPRVMGEIERRKQEREAAYLAEQQAANITRADVSTSNAPDVVYRAIPHRRNVNDVLRSQPQLSASDLAHQNVTELTGKALTEAYKRVLTHDELGTIVVRAVPDEVKRRVVMERARTRLAMAAA